MLRTARLISIRHKGRKTKNRIEFKRTFGNNKIVRACCFLRNEAATTDVDGEKENEPKAETQRENEVLYKRKKKRDR